MVEVCALFCYCLLWLETIDACIWCMLVFMYVVVRGLLKFVICLGKGCARCCVFCLNCEACGCKCSAWEVRVLLRAHVVWLCLVYILWQSSMMRYA